MSNVAVVRPELSEVARDLLLLVAPRGEFTKFRSAAGDLVIGTAEGLHLTNSPRDRAEAEAAIEELERVGYIIAIGDKREHFEVTRAGFEYVDKVKGTSSTTTRPDEKTVGGE